VGDIKESQSEGDLERIKRRNKHEQLWPPTLDSIHKIEFSVHTCPRRLKVEILRIFPRIKQLFSKDALDDLQILIVATFQHSTADLIYYGENQQLEKDRLLENVPKISRKLSNMCF
jgi:hypothetical protein